MLALLFILAQVTGLPPYGGGMGGYAGTALGAFVLGLVGHWLSARTQTKTVKANLDAWARDLVMKVTNDRLAERDREITEQSTDILKLKARVAELEAQVHGRDAELAAAHDERDKLAKRLAECQARNETLEARLRRYTDE